MIFDSNCREFAKFLDQKHEAIYYSLSHPGSFSDALTLIDKLDQLTSEMHFNGLNLRYMMIIYLAVSNTYNKVSLFTPFRSKKIKSLLDILKSF